MDAIPSNAPSGELLLVEDDNATAKLVERALDSSVLFTKLNVVPTGELLLDYVYKKRGYEGAATPDIILLDLSLPGMDGAAALHQLKEDEKHRMIPVIVMTGSASRQDVHRSYRLHANSYVEKPQTLPQFKKVILAIESYWFSIATLPSHRLD